MNLEIVPLVEVREFVAMRIEHWKRQSPLVARRYLSIAEYLKDAERWQALLKYESGDLPAGLTPDVLRQHIDQIIEEHNERRV